MLNGGGRIHPSPQSQTLDRSLSIRAIVIEEVAGLGRDTAILAMAFPSERKILVDTELRNDPISRVLILQHEFKHIQIGEKYGNSPIRRTLYTILWDFVDYRRMPFRTHFWRGV